MSGRSQIFVKSFISVCHCGKVIPYGQLSCPGHGRYSRYFFKNNKLFQLSNCANCQSTTTYIHRGVAQWRHDEVGNLICKGCYDRHWRIKHPEHVKIYNMLYRPRASQLRRERTAIKRGYGWTS